MPPVIAYGSPFVPPEWIAAFGFTPRRVIPARGLSSASEGVCPWAAAMAQEFGRAEVAGAVAVSTCDQLRRQAEAIHREAASLMLMTVPATWQGEGPRTLYRAELERLGRFLVTLGGQWPDEQAICREICRFGAARTTLRQCAGRIPARTWQEAAELGPDTPTLAQESQQNHGIPIALVGGPLCREDRWVLDLLEQLGGRLALDATETGERGLPSPYCPKTLSADPLDAIVKAFFDGIPDAFRRPDTLLYDTLDREIQARGVRAIALVRYPWCDHWHAQTTRLKERFGMPVVELDLSGGDAGSRERLATRLETLVQIAS